jgi:hypothetical protein
MSSPKTPSSLLNLDFPRRARGLGIALLLHAAVLGALLNAPPVRRLAPRQEESRQIVMLLLARPPKTIEAVAEAGQPHSRIHPAAGVRRRVSVDTGALPSLAPPVLQEAAVPAAPAEGANEQAEQNRPAAAGFDLAAARATARAAAVEHVRGGEPALAGHALNTTQAEKLGRDIDSARRGDCQTRYAGMGLLAVVPLVLQAAGGDNCKWK